MRRFLAAIVVSSLALAASPPAAAAGLGFDCDVPADHYASVTQEVGESPSISGFVQVARMLGGAHLPVAGARFASHDSKDSIGFQLIAEKVDANTFDVVMNVVSAGTTKFYDVGKIDSKSVVQFSLSLTNDGKGKLTVGGQDFTTPFKQLSSSTAMAFCSTGQFKFSDLRFSRSPTG